MKAFLGINKNGEVALFVSPFDLGVIGTRCEKGKPFPDSIRDFCRTGENPIMTLLDLQEYFDNLDKKKKK